MARLTATRPESTPQAPDWLKDAEDHPLVAQIKADRAKERLAKRKELAAQLEQVRKLREAGHPEEEAVAAATKHDLEEAKRRLPALDLAARQAAMALTVKRNALQRQADALLGELVETADPAIDGLIQAFREREARIMATPTESQVVGSERFLLGGVKVTQTASNHPARHKALAYLREGVRTLEEWKVRVEVPAAELKALEDGVPQTDVFETFESRKRLP